MEMRTLGPSLSVKLWGLGLACGNETFGIQPVCEYLGTGLMCGSGSFGDQPVCESLGTRLILWQ